jgi:UDP-N-acetylglucosamine 1-carboxyvinyltransferase
MLASLEAAQPVLGHPAPVIPPPSASGATAREVFMEYFAVEGGHPLKGTFIPAGNKNAALPILCACLLTDQEIRLHNLPAIRDVETMLCLLRDLGVEMERLGPNDLVIRARNVTETDLRPELCRQIRASLLLAGPLLARRGRVHLPAPGGDLIGRRRVDTHLLALEALGAKIRAAPSGYSLSSSRRLRGQDIFLDETSVTATENALMAATTAKGRTTIRNAASEPHVQDLARFLNSLGANISGIGANVLTVEGVDQLSGGDYRIGADHTEIASIMALAAVTGSEITITNIVPDDLRMILLVFHRLGIDVHVQGTSLVIRPKQKLKIISDVHGAIPKIESSPWPGFPTDLISIAIVAATQATGTVIIFDKMFEGRMFFVDKLLAMGARIVLCDPYRVVVTGPSALHGEEMVSPDIRAGVALLIAALCADGPSTIRNVGQIDRGYERIEERLRMLGAHIQRIKE